MFVAEVLVPEHQTKMLETRGIDISGTVAALQPRHRVWRGFRGPYVDYIYQPKELIGKPNRTARAESTISEQEYGALRIGATVLLVYDPLHPDHAQLKNFVEAHRLRKGRPYWVSGLVLVTLFPGLMLSLIMPFMLAPYFGEKRLLKWGKAAKATIVGEFEFPSGDGKKLALTYRFDDDCGVAVKGQATIYLGPADDPHPNPMTMTVVYDPRGSERNMLYPGSTVRIRP
jgi:hypothetical protein